MNREDLFVKKSTENNEEYIVDNLKRRTKELSAKDYLIHNLNLIAMPIGFDKKKDTIAIYGDRLGYFTKQLSEYYNMVSIGTMTALPIKEGWKLGVHFMTYRKWYRKIAEGYFTKNWDVVDAQIHEMERLFQKTHVKFVIVTDLYPVIQRAVCLAAKKLKLPVAHYEHTSILNLKEDPVACEFYRDIAKDYADFYWYWSKNNQDAIISRGIATIENSTIIGYPYKVDRKPIEKKKSVLWIGDGETQTSDNPAVYYNLIKEVFEYCKQHDIPFTYRAHPKEWKEFYMPMVEEGMPLSHNSLAEDLEGNLIAIGGKTTCMLEAGLYDDIALQILWDDRLVGPFLFGNAYVLDTDAENVIRHINLALKGELAVKKIPEETLLVADIKEHVRETIEKNIKQFEEKE